MTTTVQREDVEGLIKRLEEASEGSRELDLAICKKMRWCDPTAELDPDDPEILRWNEVHPFGSTVAYEPLTDLLPHYTTSLDAALTLVPEHCAISNFSIWPGEISEVDILGTHGEKDGRRWHNIRDGKWVGAGLAGPLALCIAALRARARQ